MIWYEDINSISSGMFQPSKKNVRFADLTYDEPEHTESDEKLFDQRDGM